MMNPASTFVKLIACFFLLGYGQPVFGAVRDKTPDLEALWKHYLETDAGKIPTTQFPYESCFKSAAQKHDMPLSLLLAVARGVIATASFVFGQAGLGQADAHLGQRPNHLLLGHVGHQASLSQSFADHRAPPLDATRVGC